MFIDTRFFPFSSFVSIIHPTRFVVQRKIRTWNISRSSARRARMLDFSSAFPFLKDTKRRFSNCERRSAPVKSCEDKKKSEKLRRNRLFMQSRPRTREISVSRAIFKSYEKTFLPSVENLKYLLERGRWSAARKVAGLKPIVANIFWETWWKKGEKRTILNPFLSIFGIYNIGLDQDFQRVEIIFHVADWSIETRSIVTKVIVVGRKGRFGKDKELERTEKNDVSTWFLRLVLSPRDLSTRQWEGHRRQGGPN